MICPPSFNNEMTKSICSGGWAAGFGAEAPHPLRIKPALHSLRTVHVWTNHTKNIVGDETAPYRKKVPALGAWSGARLFGAFLGSNEQEAEDGQPQGGRGCRGGTRRLCASPVAGTRWGWRQLCGAHRATWTGGAAWAPVPFRSWATGQSFAGVVVLAPKVPSLAPIPWRAGSAGHGAPGGRACWAKLLGSAGSARVQLVEGTPLAGAGGVWAGVAMAAACQAGAPSQPVAWRALGSSEGCSKRTEPRACKKRGGRPVAPLSPSTPDCPGKGSPCFGEKKILFLLGLKVGLQMHSGIGGRGERRDYHLHLGALVSVSLGVTFYTPQRPTWNRVSGPSHGVM